MGNPLARTSRAFGPATRKTVRPSLCSATEARPEKTAASRVSNSPAGMASRERASHCPDPAHRNSMPLPAARRGVSGSSTPKLRLAAWPASAALPLRAMTDARAMPCSSARVTPGAPSALPCRPGRTSPSSAERAAAASAMETLSLRVVEDGIADFDQDLAAAQRIAGADHFAHALARVSEKAEADPMTQVRRMGNRGHESLVVLGRGFGTLRDEMGAGTQAVRLVDRLEAGEARPVWID